MRIIAKICLAAAVTIALAQPVLAARMQVADSAATDNGVLRVRSGPGQGHRLIGQIPIGSWVTVGQCVRPDDGQSYYDWCYVNWNGGTEGWVSLGGLTN